MESSPYFTEYNDVSMWRMFTQYHHDDLGNPMLMLDTIDALQQLDSARAVDAIMGGHQVVDEVLQEGRVQETPPRTRAPRKNNSKNETRVYEPIGKGCQFCRRTPKKYKTRNCLVCQVHNQKCYCPVDRCASPTCRSLAVVKVVKTIEDPEAEKRLERAAKGIDSIKSVPLNLMKPQKNTMLYTHAEVHHATMKDYQDMITRANELKSELFEAFTVLSEENMKADNLATPNRRLTNFKSRVYHNVELGLVLKDAVNRQDKVLMYDLQKYIEKKISKLTNYANSMGVVLADLQKCVNYSNGL